MKQMTIEDVARDRLAWAKHLQRKNEELEAEVIRLRELMLKGSNDYTTSYTDLRDIIEVAHWELTSGEHKSNEVRIKYALISLSEVIG
mgnify:CR=1 FL=1